MKEYRKKLRRQIKGMVLFLVVSVAVIVICGVSASKLDDNAHAASFVRGFQAGIFLVWAGASVYGIVSNVRALKDERKLRQRYIEAHDERAAAIQRESGRTAYVVGLGGLITAGVAAGYFNITVFATLVAAAFFLGVTGAVTHRYFSGKM